jgi:HSP20 family protein
MTITRRSQERSLAPFGDVFDLMFRDPWTSLFDESRFGGATMPIDVKETGNEFVVEAELPGIKPEDTEVTIDGRNLTIRGRYAESREEGGKGERYLLRERRTGEFVRTITLPAGIDADNVSSTFEQGELKIVLPKAPESRARRIPVGPGSDARQVGPSR